MRLSFNRLDCIPGYMSFAQKFLKEQYHLPQSVTNTAGGMNVKLNNHQNSNSFRHHLHFLLLGIPPIFLGFVGILLGAALIRRFKFSPSQVCCMMAFSSLVGAVCYFSVIGMGCETEYIHGIDDVANPYNM